MGGTGTLGIDIGGTHVAAAVVRCDGALIDEPTRSRASLDSSADAESILETWTETMRAALRASTPMRLAGVGIAMPGPFDYPNGICTMRGVGKYDALFGVDVRGELKRRVPAVAELPMVFLNDAACFMVGEWCGGAALGATRAIGITLGTGLGSAFLADGAIVESGAGVPENGWLYNAPFRGETAEDWFSGRGLARLAASRGFDRTMNARGLAESAVRDPKARDVFEEFGDLLGAFLSPIAAAFRPDCIVAGGNVARSFGLFGSALKHRLPGTRVVASSLFEDASLVGAACLPLIMSEPDASTAGKTS